jgi:hypothetical protein
VAWGEEKEEKEKRTGGEINNTGIFHGNGAMATGRYDGLINRI